MFDDLPKPSLAPDSATAVREVGPPSDLDPTRHGEATRDFEGFLRDRIVGQDTAIEAVTEIYQMFLVGMTPPDRISRHLLDQPHEWYKPPEASDCEKDLRRFPRCRHRSFSYVRCCAGKR